MAGKSDESVFQQNIVDHLQASGWLVGESSRYHRELALYPDDLLAYVKETQPEQWSRFCKHYPNDPDKAFLKSTARELDKKGTLWLLRNEVKDRGAKLRLCTFKPDHNLNPDTLTRYRQNRLRVVPELVYSPHGYEGRLDLTLFVNGLPVATCELKSAFKQSLDNARLQYMKDRQPKDPATKKPEPLLTFKRGALVHFALSQFEVAMTTRLEGMDTFFLPFNKGTRNGGAGNDIPLNPATDGYATAYLWEEIFQPDNLLLILGRYLHLEVKDKEQADGRVVRKETMIFPRYHQWRVVNKLLDGVRKEDTGQKYLIQHSAGSGKSNSIAWLSHQLASLHHQQGDKAGQKYFDSVIVITDRTVLDSQLQDTIYQFDHNEGMIARINREESQGSKSAQLAQELLNATSIIIVTIQTFPFVLKAIQENQGLARRTFAIIADEAHSSQTGSTARQMREVLMAEHLPDDEELDSEDILSATLAARKGSDKISYFAFTATPKAKTLELFGRKPNQKEGSRPEPYDDYTMRQAIEEGFILDVLQNYTSYSLAYKLAHGEGQDSEVDSKRAKTELAKWVRLHPHNISQKVEVIVEHFRTRVKGLLNGEAKAMVVTGSRKEAVRYKLAFDKYVKDRGYLGLQAMVAFSGEVVDKESGPDPFTERNMNPTLNGRDMRKAFDTDEYPLMLVANKFQTGFDQPKLVAMYVDKKLTGVDCIQTLSRLNRTFPGKDTTFILDFVNDPQDVLEEFKTYYQVAELAGVSEPNLVYDLQHKLGEQGIYQWREVELFADAYFDPKRGQDVLANYCMTAADRFGKRYREALEVLADARNRQREASLSGDDAYRKRCERSVQAAKEAKDILDTFKKDLGSFIRFYEFISQVVDFDDRELEQLNVFAKHLLPLLRQEQLDDSVDLSMVVMTHYKLREKRTQNLKLQEGAGGHTLRPVTSIGGHVPTDRHSELLSQILEQMNDLFAGEVTDGDKLAWLNTKAAKVMENQQAVEQVMNNSEDQAMLGEFPGAVQKAVIDSMNTQNSLDMEYLSNPETARQVAGIIYRLMRTAMDGQGVNKGDQGL